MPIDDLVAARPTKSTLPIHAVTKKSLSATLKKLGATKSNFAKAQGFKGDAGQHVVLPGRDGKPSAVLVGMDHGREPWCFAGLPETLPAGRYAYETLDDGDADRAALGWLLGGYVFDRYKSAETPKRPSLVWPKSASSERVKRLAASTYLVRDLVTTPAGDLGPEELAGAASEAAAAHGGKVKIIVGDKLLKDGWPAVHAVGRAASRAPRLVDITWGDPKAPKVTLVGKGVVFDSGGLDLKSASGMLLMKKDMGGAAMAIGLMKAVMDGGLDVRLRVLIPCVENAVSGNAFRPLDVLKTRKGMTVEVGNTDAEGRLILCDALHEASQDEPELLLDFATLTGAARVALGASVPALFTNADQVAEAWEEGSQQEGDPIWRLPLHEPYRRMLDSTVADINNIASGGYGGAITAALFLKEFVGAGVDWARLDLMAYNIEQLPGRPRGGEAMGLRAAYAMLERRFSRDD